MDQATEERVRQRAYELWQLQGCPAGREQEHWDQAMQEICQNVGSPAMRVASDPNLHSDLGNTTSWSEQSDDSRGPRQNQEGGSAPPNRTR
jgi:hypothetical protein